MLVSSVRRSTMAVMAVLLGLVAALLVPTPAAAIDDGMTFLGARDFEISEVASGEVIIDLREAPGAFRELRLYNEGARIDVRQMRIRYSDGTEHVETRTFFLQKGERTRAIDPKSRDVFVDEITIFLNTSIGQEGLAQLQVRGNQTRAARNKTRGDTSNSATNSAQPALKPATREPGKFVVATSRIPKGERCGGPRSMLLATGRVGFGTDRDQIALPHPEVGKFTKLRLCVTENDIELINIDVSYADGRRETLPFDGLMRQGQRTDAMTLKTNTFIKAFDISYKKRRSVSGRARVQIWGVLSKTWLDAEAERFNDGWVQLTSGDTAGFVGFEIDTTQVPAHARGFRQLQIVPRNRDITLDYVSATFADGSSQRFAANRIKVEPSKPYGPLTIRDGPKVITKIEARYRSRFFDAGAANERRAIVEVHGHR